MIRVIGISFTGSTGEAENDGLPRKKQQPQREVFMSTSNYQINGFSSSVRAEMRRRHVMFRLGQIVGVLLALGAAFAAGAVVAGVHQ